MADIIVAKKKQSLKERRQWDIEFKPDLLQGETIVSATAIHTPPSGDAFTPIIGTPTDTGVPVVLGPLEVIGTHLLDVLALLTNDEKTEVRVVISVIF